MNLLKPIQVCSDRDIFGDETAISIMAGQIDAAAHNAIKTWPRGHNVIGEHKIKLTNMVYEWIREWDDDLAARLGRAFSVKDEFLFKRPLLANQIACNAYEIFLTASTKTENPEDDAVTKSYVDEQGPYLVDLDSSCGE